MLLAACASIAHAVPTMDTLRGSFTTRAQTISACCLLSGDSEERARKLHYSHEHWLEALHAGTDELAQAVTIFADILPRKAPQKLRDLTVTVVPALQERVVSKMWSEGFSQATFAGFSFAFLDFRWIQVLVGLFACLFLMYDHVCMVCHDSFLLRRAMRWMRETCLRWTQGDQQLFWCKNVLVFV